MKPEQPLTEQESFSIIQRMISAAKKEQKDNGMGWIIWGWMLFTVSILTILNLQYKWFETFVFWNAFGIGSIVLLIGSVIKKYYSKKKNEVQTYYNDLFKLLNIGFFICLSFIIVAINKGVGIIYGFALLVNLYAFWMLIYGAASNFKPSIIAAFLTWALAFAGLFVTTIEMVMYIQAAAALIGYIIPGHLANKAYKQQQ
jgi:hypothetical protein